MTPKCNAADPAIDRAKEGSVLGNRSDGAGARWLIVPIYTTGARAFRFAPAPGRVPQPPSGYWPSASAGGVMPMTCTPAPRAMSIASITSWYFRVGPTLMNISLAGRLS